VPGDCTISMIRTLMPGETLEQARDELDRVVRNVAVPDGAGISIEYTSPRDHPVGGTPCEVSPEHPAVRALGASLEQELDHGGQVYFVYNRVETIWHMQDAGFQGFLVGEHFMKEQRPAIAFAAFVQQLKMRG